VKIHLIDEILEKMNVLEMMLIISLVTWISVLYFNPYYFADLENRYTDHMRHEYVSWLFLHVGFKVFSTPLKELSSQAPSLHPHLVWQMHPHIYPLGSILYFMPFGILSNLGIISDVIVHKLMVLSFLAGAHLALYYFIMELKKRGFGVFLVASVSSLFYRHMVFWALNGFYDVMAILLIILSIKYWRKGSSLKSLVVLTASFFLHYRSIFYLPLWIVLFAKILFQHKNDLWNQLTRFSKLSLSFMWFLIVALLDLYTAYLSFLNRTWEIPAEWKTSIINVYSGKPDAQMLLLALSAIVFLILVKRKSYITGSTMLLCLAYMLFTPNWMHWHHLFFFPTMLIPSNKISVEAAAFWLVTTIYLTAGFISPLWISQLLQMMFQ